MLFDCRDWAATTARKFRRFFEVPFVGKSLAFLLLGLVGAVLGIPAVRGQDSQVELDRQTLQSAGVAANESDLLEFFRQRTLSKEDTKEIEALVEALGSKSYQEREKATKSLVLRGQAALPFLQKAISTGTLEARERARNCIQLISRVSSPEVEAAAARYLAHLQPREAMPTLLNYHAFAVDEWVKEEVLSSLGKLTIHNGQADPFLMEVLKHKEPDKRAVAAFLLAQRGNLVYRKEVRKLLVDPAPQVRDMAARGLLGSALLNDPQDLLATDEQLLKKQNVSLNQAGLVDFLKQRSLNEADQTRLKSLIDQLGSKSYVLREKALKEIMNIDLPALGFLVDALNSKNTELVLRAEMCIQEIRRGPGPALPAAAVRYLAKFPAAESVAALLEYIPFAPDEMVEEEVINSLCLLALRQEVVDESLVKALEDSLPARRGAAAFVLGKVGTEQDCRLLVKMLADPHPLVRYRAAQGLLAAKDNRAIPVLIALAEQFPPEKAWPIEDILNRVAGNTSPNAYLGTDDPKAKARAVQEWKQWWAANSAKVDLSNAVFEHRQLGLYTICEYDNQNGRVGGKIWECGRDGKPRWEITGVMGPMDAEVLPNGRVLIAESNALKVTERDKTGKIFWEHRVTSNPVACQRLPNGNYFIATYRELMEITPDKRVVYNHNTVQPFIYYSAKKLPNGKIVAMTSRGELVEIDSAKGTVTKTLKVQQGGWCGVDMLPNGNYLVSQMVRNSIEELDGTGKVIRQMNYQGVFRATRLSNGNTLAVSMNFRKVAELDRSGNVVWEQTCQGRPWSIRFR
jgi:HEAT repeat protein